LILSIHLPPGSRSWTLVVGLARVFIFANFMTLAAVIPVLRREWELSATSAGALVTGFTLAYSVSLFIFGWAADHIGAKRAAVISAAASAVASLLFGFLARDYWSALFFASLSGLAQGGVYTPLVMLFSEHAPPARRGAAMGALIASTSFGYAGSLALASIGMAVGGWQEAFLFTGLAPTVGAVILILALRGTINIIHPRTGATNVWHELAVNRSSRLLVGGYIAHNWELVGGWAWLPAVIGASLTLSGAASEFAAITGAGLSAAMHLTGAAASFSMGRLSDHVGRKAVLVSVASIGAALSLVLGWAVVLPPLTIILLGFAYAFSTLGDSPVLSIALAESVSRGYLGVVLAYRSLIGFAAGALAPLAAGAAMDGARAAGASMVVEWGAGFTVLGVGGVLAVVAAARLPRDRSRREMARQAS
jgi:MFS family permease